MKELEVASRMAPPEDMALQQILGGAYEALDEPLLYIEHCAKYYSLAKRPGADPGELIALERLLQEWLPRLTPVYITNSLPADSTHDSLGKALRQKLASDEVALVVNPLASSPEMKRWATALPAGATNDFQKAKMIFDELIHHVKNDALLPDQKSMTAKEVFTELTKTGPGLRCQQTTVLFTALARAVGLQVYVVQVEEAYDGTKTPHACAAAYLGGKCLLVDLTYFWFGVPHARFTVLNDLQAIGLYLCTSPDLRRVQVAANLVPDIALVQDNLCRALMAEGRWAEARKMLPQIERLDGVGVIANARRGEFAAHEGKLEDAIVFFQRAIQIDPHDFSSQARLGEIYASRKSQDQARGCFENALRCPHTASEERWVRQALAEIKAAVTGSTLPN